MNPKSFPTHPTAGRDLAFKKSKLATAEALAAVARYSPDDQVEKLAKEAMDTASEQTDPYNVVAVSAWPVRALIERKKHKKAEQVISQMLALSDQITHPVSRLEALFMLWQAVYPMGGKTRQQVQEKFVAACQGADSWKAGDRLAWAATIVAADSPKEGYMLAGLLREGRHKRSAIKRVNEGRTEKMRGFFD